MKTVTMKNNQPIYKNQAPRIQNQQEGEDSPAPTHVGKLDHQKKRQIYRALNVQKLNELNDPEHHSDRDEMHGGCLPVKTLPHWRHDEQTTETGIKTIHPVTT